MSKSFVFVTGNAGKLREVKQILAAGDSGITCTNQSVEVPEIQGTTQEVALAKVKAACAQLNAPCVTEDTALCFEALGGLPGPYIKDFLLTVGHDGLNKMLVGFNNTRAFALCTFAYCAPGSEPILFEGRTDGNIVPARGPSAFGWDPTFEPLESGGKTYAEMAPEDKNKISHRYRALEKLKDYLSQQ